MNLFKRLFGPAKKAASGGVNKSTPPKKSNLLPKETTPVVEELVEEKIEEPHGLSEFSIKEIMVQKSCTREQAIEILKNPAKE